MGVGSGPMTTATTGMPYIAPPNINEFAGWVTLVLACLCILSLPVLIALRRKIRHAGRWLLLVGLVGIVDWHVMRHQVFQEMQELERYFQQCAAVNFKTPECDRAKGAI